MRFPRSGPVLLAPVVLALAALAACNGGSSTVPTFPVTPTTPATVPSLAPAAASTTVPLATSSGSSPASQTIAIPPVDGLSGQIVLPGTAIPAGTTLTLQTTTTLPAGLPTLQSTLRAPRATGGSAIEPLLYQGLEFSQTLTFSAFPAFQFVLPAGYSPSQGYFSLAFYNGSSWSYPLGSPATVSGQALVFTSAAGPVTYQALRSYYFALYYTPNAPVATATPSAAPTATASPTAAPTATASPTSAPTATPTATASPSSAPSSTPTATASPTSAPTATASPTAVPTATPTAVPTATPTATPTPTPGPLAVSPTSLSFLGTGSNLAQTVTISAPFFTGTFAASACVSGSTTVATVSSVASDGTFTVTPAAAGACTITVTDSSQRTATVSVTVATSSLTVQGKHH